MLPKIAHLPGRWFFRPLAICLSFLMLPHIPNLSFMSGVPAAMAQADNSCTPNMNRIIQDICSPGAPSAALLQFENESVAIWLAAHNLPATDAALIYRYGRLELRSELRSFMFTRLLDIVKKSKLEMNAYETAINNWFVNRVWNLEKAMYKAAVDDKNRWKQDLCSWRPDADIARAYNLSYDYYVWCGNSLALLFSAPPVPVKSYFLAAALKNTYGKSVSDFDNGPMVLAKTGSYIATQLGVAAASGVAGGAFAAGLVFAAAASLFPYSIRNDRRRRRCANDDCHCRRSGCWSTGHCDDCGDDWNNCGVPGS